MSSSGGGFLSPTVAQVSRTLTPSGGDDSANLIAALTAIAGNGTILLAPGTFLWNTSVPSIAAGAAGIRIMGSGVGETTIRLSGSAPRFLDFNRTADYQTFQNLEITDLTVDCNGVGGSGHVVIGTASNWPTSGQRVNLTNIICRRITVINAPSDANTAVNHRLGIWLGSYHPGVNEATQTRVTDILVEDFTMRCGNGGALAFGGGPAGGENILVDNVRFSRCEQTIPLPFLTAQVVLPGDASTFTLPVTSTTGWAAAGHVRGLATDGTICEVAYTSTDATDFLTCTVVTGGGKTLGSGAGVGYPVTSNFQVGSRGIGGDCTIRDIRAGGSGDNSLEINAMTNALIENYECVDDLNSAFVQINYQTPLSPAAQRIVYRDCVFRRTDPYSSASAFSPGRSTSVADLIEVVFERCKLNVTADARFSGGGQAILIGAGTAANVRKLIVKGFSITQQGISAAIAAGVTPTWFDFNNSYASAEVNMEDVDATISGAITGGFGTNARLVSLAGAGTVFSIRDLRWDFNVTGTSGGGVVGIIIGALAASVMRGDVSRFIVKQLVAASPRAVRIATGNLTPDAKHLLTFTDCDFGAMTSGTEILHDTVATSGPFTRTRRNTWLNRPAPAGLTGLVTATGKQLATVGYACLASFIQGTGAGITAVDYSTDGGTTYTNLLTQGAGALPAGFGQALGPLTPDALIKVTFATTQPTITLVPVDP